MILNILLTNKLRPTWRIIYIQPYQTFLFYIHILITAKYLAVLDVTNNTPSRFYAPQAAFP